jgi:hypothetical protein
MGALLDGFVQKEECESTDPQPSRDRHEPADFDALLRELKGRAGDQGSGSEPQHSTDEGGFPPTGHPEHGADNQ